MRISIILIGFLLFYTEVFAQRISDKKYLTTDYQLVVDNDVFTLKIKQDQYYTSGIFPAVRFLRDSIRNTKVITTFQLNHRIYTPRKVTWRYEYQMDRPYAGMASISGINEYYFPTNQYLKVHLELGWIGPKTLADKTQMTYHGWFGMPPPNGWDLQISDAPIINIYGTYLKTWYSVPGFELNTETNLSLGTIYDNVRQEFMIRFGDFKPITSSALTGGLLGNRRLHYKQKEVSEFYLLYAPGVEYVFHNTTLEGNLFNDKSPYTEQAFPWVFQHRFGMMLSWPRFDFGFIAYFRTHENEKAEKHDYVGVRLNQRF